MAHTISTYRKLCTELDPSKPETIAKMNRFISGTMKCRFMSEETGYTANAIASDLFESAVNMIETNMIDTKDFAETIAWLAYGRFFDEIAEILKMAKEEE